MKLIPIVTAALALSPTALGAVASVRKWFGHRYPPDKSGKSILTYQCANKDRVVFEKLALIDPEGNQHIGSCASWENGKGNMFEQMFHGCIKCNLTTGFPEPIVVKGCFARFIGNCNLEFTWKGEKYESGTNKHPKCGHAGIGTVPIGVDQMALCYLDV